jgi:hypothetical protein
VGLLEAAIDSVACRPAAERAVIADRPIQLSMFLEIASQPPQTRLALAAPAVSTAAQIANARNLIALMTILFHLSVASGKHICPLVSLASSIQRRPAETLHFKLMLRMGITVREAHHRGSAPCPEIGVWFVGARV